MTLPALTNAALAFLVVALRLRSPRVVPRLNAAIFLLAFGTVAALFAYALPSAAGVIASLTTAAVVTISYRRAVAREREIDRAKEDARVTHSQLERMINESTRASADAHQAAETFRRAIASEDEDTDIGGLASE